MKFHMFLLLLGMCLGAGCDQQQRMCPCPEGERLDEGLMLVLSSARALHHQADIQLRQGRVDPAVTTIGRVLALNLDPRWPEAEEVRLDATARLAKVLKKNGEVTRGLALVKAALNKPARQSFYLSNLHSVLGELLEADAQRLERQGNKEQAQKAARRALAAYERSIAINKRLQQALKTKETP